MLNPWFWSVTKASQYICTISLSAIIIIIGNFLV